MFFKSTNINHSYTSSIDATDEFYYCVLIRLCLYHTLYKIYTFYIGIRYMNRRDTLYKMYTFYIGIRYMNRRDTLHKIYKFYNGIRYMSRRDTLYKIYAFYIGIRYMSRREYTKCYLDVRL